jgi:DNA repair exonuclease SbcCD ATPase subunit
MAERQQDVPRVVHKNDVPPVASPARVDVEELLAQLAERSAELAEARMKRKHAEANLKTKARELDSERKARKQTSRQLEGDRSALETERDQHVAACRQLKAHVAEQRKARAAAEAELKRAETRSAALQHQFQVVSAQLRQQKPEEPQPWWRRFGS